MYVSFVRNKTTELWQNVTQTSVVINVDSESRYNASVSSWTRLGDGGVLIYISFTTTEAGTADISFVCFDCSFQTKHLSCPMLYKPSVGFLFFFFLS